MTTSALLHPPSEGTTSRRSRSAQVLLLAAVLLWSANFTAVKYSLTHGFSPLSFAAVRWTFAAVALSAVTLRFEGSLRFQRRDIPLLIGVAGGGFWFNQMSLVFAIHLAPASTIALIFGLFPILVALLSHACGVERLKLRHGVAVVVSFAGAALVAIGARTALGGHFGGILFGVANAFFFASFAVVVVPLMRRYSPYRITAVASVVCSALLAITGGPNLVRQDWGGVSNWAWFALTYSATSLVIGNILWLKALRLVGPGRASLYSNFQAFPAAVLAFVILSEPLSGLQIVGGAVIALGILLAHSERTPAPSLE
ncbi:MAG: DMT family transporter [Thermoleophilia bacterium]|nr:DMT family transporter [Thermoleophilia bacterium]